MTKYIYDKDEHNLILLELNLLDDLDDWPLYQLQENRFYELDKSIDDNIWRMYVNLPT